MLKILKPYNFKNICMVLIDHNLKLKNPFKFSEAIANIFNKTATLIFKFASYTNGNCHKNLLISRFEATFATSKKRIF